MSPTMTPGDHYNIAAGLARDAMQARNGPLDKYENVEDWARSIEVTLRLAQVHATLATCRPGDAA